MKAKRPKQPRRKPVALYLAVILAMVFSLAPNIIPGVEVPKAEAHNLQTKMVYMFFDPNTQTMLDARIASPSWTPPTPLLQVNDELGIIIKVVPRDGTNTGVGGHVDFYVPNGTTVVDAAYLLPGDANPSDGLSGYDKVPMKGQSLIAVGDGPIGAKTTTQLIGLGTVGPNVLGFSTNPVVPATGLHRGTIAGVYGDTGIFYATDPDTSYGSWQRFTGDPDQICGLAGLPGVTGKTITNNSGDVFVPCNKWDAGQMYAWGVKGTSWTGSGAATAPIVDYGDGRGNAPWGFASGVAGPQSGYGWNFNWNEWRTSAKTAQDMRNAMGNDELGPWKRIRYPGSRISSDQPGTVSTVLGIASVDGSSVGYALGPSNPLPATVSQSDTTSPKAVRWAVGQLTNLVPELVWVKIKVNSVAAIVNADGCPVFNADTFGGDAGGSDNGKDHLWRYYEPSRATWNGCLALGKPATRELVKVGDNYQYKIKIYNAGTINDFTNLVVKDTLPSGVQFISSFPAQVSGPNPLVWNVPSLKRGEMWEATVTVKATGTGVLENTLCVDAAGTTFDQCVEDDTTSGPYPMLRQGKTASVTAVAPGNPVQYTIQIDNIGSGPTGSPITVNDYLPTGFTFASKDLVTINGANVTATTTVNTGAPGQALFTVPGALNAGQSLIIKYTLNVPTGATAGTYCNSYTTTQNSTPLTTGSLACITVGSGAIGDTLFRDWNGNGVQDPEDEGIAGVTVELQNGSCTPGSTCPTTTTDANGNYIFEGLAAGTYTVKITDLGEDGLPASGDEVLTGYTQTYDPNGICLPTPGAGCDTQSTVTLTLGQRNMDQDFGFKPGGTGSIGDTLWKDDGSGGGTAGNGAKDGTEPGIANVTVYLYEDTNGNGAIDPDDALVATDVTDASGLYGFTGLAVDLNYLVKIDEADPDFLAAFSGGNPISASTSRLQSAQPTTDTPAIDTVDFGYYQPPPAAVGDTVCIDTNGDRLCTGADTPLPNIEVAIYRDLNRNGLVDPGEPLLGTDVTDANGVYGFSGLASGAYVVEVNTADPDLPGGLATTLNPQGVFLSPGETNLAIDFPFVQRLTKSVRNVTTNQNPGANASPGDTLEYKITPNYTGSNLLSSLKVTDTVPTGTTFVSAAPAQTSGPDPLVWNLGSNTAGVPGVGVLCPVTVELDAQKDTLIAQNDGDENKNYGSSTVLETANEANKDIAGLLRFDLSSIPSGAALDTATLKLTVEGGQGTNRQIEVHELLTSFTEGTGGGGGNDCTTAGNGASWGDTDGNDAGRGGPNCTDSWTPVDSFTSANYGATNYGTIDPLVDETTYSVNVKTLVQSWLTTPASNIGFAVIPVGTGTNAVTWHSHESTTATKRPKLVIKYLVAQTGACTINTDGLSVFSVNANASKYSAFNGTTNVWGSATNMAAFANKQRFLTLASGTTRNESIATAVLDNNTTAGQFWNGTAWSALPNPPAGASGQLGTVSTDTFYSTDVAYEAESGDALVVWDDNAQTGSAKLRFATYDGTTWSAAASVGAAYTGGEPLYMHLDSAPAGDSMVLAVNDLTFDDYAMVWDGAAWGNGVSLDASGTATDDRTSLYAAHEATSGDALVVYAKTNDAKVYYRIWDGASWSAEASLSAPAGVSSQPQWLVLASDPSTDRIALGVLTTNKTVWLSVWDGSVWGATATATTGAQTQSSPVVSVAFESLTGRALAVYAEGKNVRYTTWTSITNAWSVEQNGPVLADNGATFLLDADPNSNEIMLTAMGSGKRVQAGLWSNGWGALTLLSGNTNYNTGQPFDFHWNQNVLTQSNTKAALTTNRTLVTDTGGGQSVLVTLTTESATAGTVTANALTVSVAGGAGATCGAASPAGPQPIAANGQVQFTYTCTVTAGAAPGSVTFSTTPTAGGGAGGFTQATSNSVLATPPLTYRVTVNNPATVAVVKNTAQLGDGSGTIPQTNSNETQTVLPNGSIGDFVWYDTNGNGLQDETNCAGSPCGAPNATLVLVQDTNGNGIADIGEPVIATYITDSTGAYLFDNLPPGNYVVQVSEQEIPSPTSGVIGRMVGTSGTSKPVTLALGQDVTTVDFGFVEAAYLEGTLFHDVNHNGVLDPGEPILPNVTVTLTGTDANGNPVSYTTTTDANGDYFFLVPPGSYTITYNTSDPDIPPGLTEPTTPTSINLTAIAGVEYTGLDFGRDNAGRIGDRVWNDSNTNGTQNAGELGLANVTVYLCSSTPCTSANAIATTATDTTGFYQFVGLPDGTYYVGVNQATVPSGYNQTGYGDPGGSCGGCTGQSPAVPLAGGATVSSVDFGYSPPLGDPAFHSVSGRVWDDQDGSGSQNGAEPGIPGVSVCLYNSTGTTVIACTTTLANGDYTFPGLPNGTYVIKVDPTTLPSTAYYQTGDPDAVKDNKTTVTVNNANVTGRNFGYDQLLGSISGTLCEGTGDGLCDDPGDVPLGAGVPVFLTYAGDDGFLGTPDDVVYTDTTDSSGNYAFSNLPPGDYQITKSNPAGTVSLADADGGNPNNISVTLDFGPDGLPNTPDDRMNKSDQDFEVTPATGVVGDRVWLDVDGDGVQDNGEPGLANVEVTLYADDDGTPGPSAGDTVIGTALTDTNGNYLFSDVPAGTYYVDVNEATLPSGLDPSPGTTDPSALFTLTPGDSFLDADFGFTPVSGTAVIGDFVWADADADGVQDPGDVGIAGVDVTLLVDLDGDGNFTDIVDVTTTGPDGKYLFTGVTPGKYKVQVDDGTGTPLVGYTPTSGPESQGSDTSVAVTVAAGDVVTTLDFGYDKPALYTVSDRVWYDADRNGVLDPGESGIGGVTVNLLDSTGNVIATVVTNPDGTFTFSGVPNGVYTIEIADNGGILGDFQPTTPSALAGERPVVVSGSNVTGTNFGYAGLGPIGDTVFSDHDGDGVQDPGEPGIGGVTVNLYFDDGDGVFEPGTGDLLITSQVTDAAGHYLFNDLPQGTFWVSVTDTQAPLLGYTATTADQHPGTPNSTEYLVTLSPTSPSFLGADFGYQNTTLADVSGTVWNDTNNNGIQQTGEPGIPGVTVCLVNSAGVTIACTTTDPNGNYTFFDVPPGNYTVVVTDEDNILDGYTLTSGLDAIPVTVGSSNIGDVDFGYVRNPEIGAIGDTVWMDANSDGQQNGGEPGIANVTVWLKAAAPVTIGGVSYPTNATIATAITDIDGHYLFPDLPAGSYYVDVDQTTLPAGLAATAGTTDPTATISLSTGESYLDADFGYNSQTGSAIGDTVWHDVDGDGIQDPGEPGIGGVTVTVTGPSCPAGCTATTAPDGTWLIPGLTSGTYDVVVTPPPGYTAGTTNWPSGATSIQVILGSNDILYADFGFDTGPTGPTGTVGDRVWLDTNGNGVQDPGEAGIPGVTVNLVTGAGVIIATTTTDANGSYLFVGVPNGTYTVAVTDINNVLAGLPQTGDPDQPGVPCTTCDNQGTATVTGGGSVLTMDFGYRAVGGSIGNQLWRDVNENGVFDPGESGIEGVRMDLWLDVDNDGVITPGVDNLVRTAFTDVTGQYEFTGLPAARYLVDVATSNFATGGVLQGFNKTSGAAGQNNNSQADPYLVTLTSTGGVVSSNATADFGYTAPGIGFSISGTVFNDANNNGIDNTEPPIPGTTVFLYRQLPDGTLVLLGTTVSNGTGDYQFTDLPPGNYVVATNALSTTANGYYQTTQTGPSNPVQPVTITAANVIDQDFGYYRPPVVSLSISLDYFQVVAQGSNAKLEWATLNEIDLLGFNLYRAPAQTGPWTKLNTTMIAALNPGSSQGNVYQWTDPNLASGQYWFRLDWVEATGTEIAAIDQVQIGSTTRKTWMPLISNHR